MKEKQLLGWLSVFVGAALVLATSPKVYAAVLFSESFTYSDGELSTASSGTWGKHSPTGMGSEAFIQNISNNALFINDDSTADYSRSLGGAISSGTLFAGFDLNLPTADPPTSTSGLDHYFAHFAETVAGTGFVSRVFAFSAPGGVYKLSIQRVSGSGETKTDFPTTFGVNTTHRVVLAYDFSSQASTLWLDPISIASTSVSNNTGGNPLPTALNWFAFRNHNTSSGDKIVDNLIVATTFAEALGSTAQAGDFDGDGDVDGADFVVWQTNFPADSGHSLATGDADGDNDVDGADFAKWQDSFPHSSGSGVAPVPEPAAWILMGLALPALGLLRKRWTA